MFEYDPETKRQSIERHTSTPPTPNKTRRSKSKIKPVYLLFRYPGNRQQKINVQLTVLPRGSWKTSKMGHRVRSNTKYNWMLHLDSAPCHMTVSINEFLVTDNSSASLVTWLESLWLSPLLEIENSEWLQKRETLLRSCFYIETNVKKRTQSKSSSEFLNMRKLMITSQIN